MKFECLRNMNYRDKLIFDWRKTVIYVVNLHFKHSNFAGDFEILMFGMVIYIVSLHLQNYFEKFVRRFFFPIVYFKCNKTIIF